MAPIKLASVVSCSSEDKTACAKNLLVSDSFKKWAIDRADKTDMVQASVILQLEYAQQITGLDIGNNGSAFVEVLVANSADSTADEAYENLIITAQFMSPGESRTQTNRHKMRMFGKEQLCKATVDKKWDRVKVVCTQPYNKKAPFGLSVLIAQGPKQPAHKTPKEDTQKVSTPTLVPRDVTTTPRDVTTIPRDVTTTPRDVTTTPRDVTMTTSATSESKAASNLLSKLQKSTTSEEALERLKTSGGTLSVTKHPLSRVSIHKSVIDISDDKGSPTSSRDVTMATRDVTMTTRDVTMAAPGSSSSTKPTKAPVTAAIPQTDFSSLLDGVVFVLSGFQNPLRKDIREIGLSMGGSYWPDWCSDATHLICAIANTPKFNQVKGKGVIVSKEWLFDCKRKRTRLPESKFRMDKTRQPSSSSSEEVEEEEEMDDEEEERRAFNKRKHSKRITYTEVDSDEEEVTVSQKRRNEKKETTEKDSEYIPSVTISSSDEEEEVAELAEDKLEISEEEEEESAGNQVNHQLPDISDSEEEMEKRDPYEEETDDETSDDVIRRLNLPPLPDIFTGHSFYLHTDSMEQKQSREIVRYLIAYGGAVYEHMSPEVKFIVSNSVTWQPDFKQALAANPRVKFLRSSWVIESSNELKSLDKAEYYISQ